MLAVATAIVVLVTLGQATRPVPAIGLLVVIAVLTPWIFAAPLRGLQILVGAAITIEVFILRFPDSFTDEVPFFYGLNNSAGIGVSVTPAELLMGVTIVAALVRSGPMIRARLFKGRLFPPYLLFLMAVLMGEVHGLLNGGDFNKSLWELRPQVYGFIGFVIASLVIRSRQDLERLALIAAVAIAFKGVIGDVRYFIVLNHNLGAHETVLGHEDSYFLALLPLAALAALIWTGRTRALTLLVIATAIAAGALLANERRAGILALAGGAIVIVLLAIRFNGVNRRRVILLALIAAVIVTAFLIAFWNVQNGLIGQLVRPVRSQFDPSLRDYLSDIYRQAENINLQLSFKTNKLIGMGFGMPFLTVLAQADISTIYPLWNYIPHNTLLWVGVRMGLVGSIAFWALFGTALLEVCRALSVQRDRFVLTLVALVGGAIVCELLVAYADLQLESYRNMIFIGAIFGVLNVLPALFPEPAAEKRSLA
ncbi:MAG TPA: O-antigen ligase family protein [Candidatus Dormibacteraeota bacterium]